ncbi:sulfite exporter TauE/SafE family protein [Halopseudomonas pachastrellae]|uniref:sulfite exporter TauE/SafE family protein n=1 Tax=Halopseudomonas pachastrellae TaxID=254161 RepID=UPI003D7DC13A|tara:strand:- start:10381 stop:11166 length:786 start_codon:yes stop_codon:yes gene_type:complete
MTDLSFMQYALIGLIFVWSGFVRSGLGFGGAVLSLPFLLLVHDDPLVFLPLIAAHLLLFSFLTVFLNNRRRSTDSAQPETTGGTVDWRYLGHMLAVMMIPKLIGVFGLLTLPPQIMSLIIFVIVSGYALSYIFNRPFRSNSRWLDTLFLMLGGYISGTSLIGAPLIIAVAAQHIAREKLRDTLFVLWFVLVSIKMAAFVWAGVDLQLIHHLWLLPCVTVGHLIGLRFHNRMLHDDSGHFFRVLGVTLLVTSAVGLGKVLMT